MVQKSRAADAPIVIKKYANRRLYNTAKSSYVTLDDLSRMVRAGDDFQVFDAKTGEEITRSVLTQIIFEEEAKGQNMLPTNFLRRLIRLYGDALQGVVPGYLDASMETFARNQERMREAFGTNQAMQTFEAMTRSNMEWFEQAMKMFGPFAAPPFAGGRPGEGGAAGGSGGEQGTPGREASGAPGYGAPGGPQGQGQAQSHGQGSGQRPAMEQDLEQLQQQLRAMQDQLEKLSRPYPPITPTPSKPAAPSSQAKSTPNGPDPKTSPKAASRTGNTTTGSGTSG